MVFRVGFLNLSLLVCLFVCVFVFCFVMFLFVCLFVFAVRPFVLDSFAIRFPERMVFMLSYTY